MNAEIYHSGILGKRNHSDLVFDRARAMPYRFGMNRLREIRESKRMTQSRLAELAKTTQPQIRRLEAGLRKLTREWAERLAPPLEVTPQFLLFGPGESAMSEEIAPAGAPRQAPIRGTVAANQWFTDEEFIDEDQPLVPFIPGKFVGLEQFAFKVRGPCMDLRRIFSGDYVICVNYFDARAQMTDGDIVVVERRRGQMIERTCKELQIVDGGFELWPRSTNAKYQMPIRIKNMHDPLEEDGTAVEVVALVIGRYSPF